MAADEWRMAELSGFLALIRTIFETHGKRDFRGSRCRAK